MNIGTVAARSAVPAKTIRYYESIGLLPPAGRSSGGYRTYDDKDVETLRFVQRARSLGFSVKDVGNLLALWRDQGRASADVREMALAHVREIERKVDELQSIRDVLLDLIDRCHGDHRPQCPILDRLASPV